MSENIQHTITSSSRLSYPEKMEMLRIFDEVVPRIPERDTREVGRELKALRRARRTGGRRASSRKDA